MMPLTNATGAYLWSAGTAYQGAHGVEVALNNPLLLRDPSNANELLYS
jgi:hypothetical protein